jgi:cell division protein FtsB
MRFVTVALVALLLLIQYPLWWGHGGWLKVHELQQQLASQEQQNVTLKLRNERLEGEVADLKTGTAAIEERARYEMGMLRDSELFVQFVAPNDPIAATVPAGSSVSTRGQMSAVPVSVVPDPAPRARKEKRSRKGERSTSQPGKKAAHR